MIPPPPEKCEQTSWHSAQKHAFLEAYLKIWTENVGKKKNPPSLDIIDLFASFGWCHSTENNKTWPGTSILSAQCLKDYRTSHKCLLFLNSYSPQADEQDKQISALREAVQGIQLDDDRAVIYSSSPIGTAVEEAIKRIRPNYPNLWLLDPYSSEDLPWETVERILDCVGHYTKDGKEKKRRPELFITLMTSGLQRNIDTNPHMVSRAFGVEEHIWRPQLTELKVSGMNTRLALTKLYSDRLKPFYGKDPLIMEVPSTQGNIVYVVIFCTEHNAAYYMTDQYAIPRYEEWKLLEWTGPAREEARTKKVIKKAQKAGQIQKRFDI